jgi:hypothetical protein
VKVNYLTLLAGATIMLLTATATRADEPAVSALAMEANAAPAATPAVTTTASTAPVAAASGDTATYYQDSDPVADYIARAGAWGVHQTGSPTKVDEYQSPQSSPFWNADGIWSNGERTIDFSATGADDADTDGRLHYYGGSRLEADLAYERFPHELDSKTYPGWTTIPAAVNTNGANFNVFSHNDLNAGQDYAISVQDYKANFKGFVTDNLKWRVNVFGIDKEGFRQANGFTHCYDATPADVNTYPAPFKQYGTGVNQANAGVTRQCHVVSQAQHIDWQTNQVEAALELHLNCDTTVEYSHLVRAFEQNDQQVTNIYRGNNSTLGFPISTPAYSTAGYAIVPDNQTQIDRLKFCTKIGCNTDFYLLGYAGYNEDMLRDTYRNFNGADLRITNTSIDTLTLTARAKYYREDTTNPLTALNTQYPGSAGYYQEPNLSLIGPQINREDHAFGIDAQWRPWRDEHCTPLSSLIFVGGYEYSTLLRENAGDTLLAPGTGPFVSPSGVASPPNFFTQPSSNKNTFTVGVEEKWSPKFDTFLRYKFISTDYPLYGITPDVGSTIDNALNSSLPTQENRVELGCTWTPTDCLMVNATLYVENAMSDAPYVAWTSNSLPFTVSAWWAPTQNWSFSIGAAEMDSWINQNVSMGPLNATGPTGAVNIPANFTGVADVLTLGTRYAATEKLSFTGEFEYVHGIDTTFAVVPTAQQTPATGAPYDVGQYSLVKMQSYRFGVGADYLLRPRVTTYVRYNYYDYQDESGLTSGQANMILGGVSATF